MDTISSSAEALLYHFANRYLRQLLPSEYLEELQDCFLAAEQQVNDHPEALAWSQRVLWLSHWDGLLSSPVDSERVTTVLSPALLKNLQVTILYQGKDKSFRFNIFGLIKRDDDLLIVGSHGHSSEPVILSVRKILDIQLTDSPSIQPAPGFDLHNFKKNQLNFPHAPEKIDFLQIEFAEELYSYVKDHELEADQIHLVTPENYHHRKYFLLEAHGIADGERFRQWIRGFGSKAQVLKPDDLRLKMEQARLDSRTNLLTVTEFKRCMNREIQRCLRDNQMTFALLMLDLDHFKQVNDLNGHDFGDVVLLEVANCIRQYDEAARYGGEEFSILLPNTSADAAFAIADRIRLQIEQQLFKNQHDRVVPVTTSIGLAVYPDDLPTELKTEIVSCQHIADLSDKLGIAIFHQADQALYQAKKHGRNRVYMCSGSDMT